MDSSGRRRSGPNSPFRTSTGQYLCTVLWQCCAPVGRFSVGHAVTDCVLVSKVASGGEGKVEGVAAEVILGPPAGTRAIELIRWQPFDPRRSAESSIRSSDQGTMPHSNILLAIGAAILFRNCSRIFGSLFRAAIAFCFIAACWGSGACSFWAFNSSQLDFWYFSITF